MTSPAGRRLTGPGRPRPALGGGPSVVAVVDRTARLARVLARFPDVGWRLCGWLCKLPAGKRLEAEAMLSRGGRVPEVADELGVLPEQVQRVADAMRKRESRKWHGKSK